MENEIERIKKVYERRKNSISYDLYSCFNEGNLFLMQSRECEIIRTLKKYGIRPLDDKKILDFGCGNGGELRNFVKYGAVPGNLSGVDLLSERIETARRISPGMDFICCDASNIPYPESSFDLVMQFTVFTSILDYSMKQNIAREMVRVLKPKGFILWYDYHMNNPKNSDVRGIKKKEIYSLFPDCRIGLKQLTLVPPLARMLAPVSLIICQLLQKVPFLCTHYLGIIQKGD